MQSRHPGIKKMLYFVRRVDTAAVKVEIKQVIKNCEMCQLIDPEPVQWQKRLEASDVWQRVGMDITNYGGNHFLTLSDCGPTHFAI